MKRQIRIGVFETNSSMCHALSMCTEEEFEKWKNGDIWWDRWEEEFVPVDNNMNYNDRQDEGYTTYGEFQELEYEEIFEKKYVTPSGETVVAFGYAGHD